MTMMWSGVDRGAVWGGGRQKERVFRELSEEEKESDTASMQHSVWVIIPTGINIKTLDVDRMTPDDPTATHFS